MADKPPFHPERLPSPDDPECIELASGERKMLKSVLTTGQIEDIVPRPAFRHFIANVKNLARIATNQLVSGVGPPKGLENASAREAYFCGLVNNARAVLDLQRKLWAEAVEMEKAAEEEEKQPRAEPENSPFTDSPIETFASPGD
jgi:hypothetical protein